MSYLAYKQVSYWHTMQSDSNGSDAVLMVQQRLTPPKNSQQVVLWLVTKNQLSVTLLLTPPLVLWDMEQSVHSRSHRARGRQMLDILRVTALELH